MDYAPFTVCPAVRGFTQQWNCLQGRLISSEIRGIIHNTGGIMSLCYTERRRSQNALRTVAGNSCLHSSVHKTPTLTFVL